MADRYLVTGAAGFIGSQVCRRLLDAGHDVVGVDQLNDAYDPRLKQWRLEQLSGSPQFSFERLDIADREAVARFFSAHTSDKAKPFRALVNLAARAGVRPSVKNPRVYFEANLLGTLYLLDECIAWGIKKFVLASTSSLYGAQNPTPFREDSDTSRPLSPYAASKKAAEALAYTYHYLHGRDITVLRYFTVYGPAGRPDMSVFRFVRQIAEGLPIQVFGDGTQQRDFTYVDDIADGTVRALAPSGYEVINLGSDRPVQLNSVIEQIGKLVGQTPRIEHRPPHPADVPATWANIGKARAVLGWSPRVPIEEGLARSVQWYRDHRELALSIELGE